MRPEPVQVKPFSPSRRVRAPILNVLVIDDDESVREALRSAVEDLGYACAAAADGLEAWRLCRQGHFDVVLCDWLMPRMDGLELCRKVRVQCSETEAYTYFILVTGLADKAHLVRGLREGADEYLTKPIAVEELDARLKSAARVVALNRRLVEKAGRLRYDSQRVRLASAHTLQIARIDPLTQINNRLGLDADLSTAMAHAKRYGHKYSVGICDVDLFKRYNDTHGHLAGDEVLVRVAEAMKQALRAGDGIYRYGGEEFLVLLPEQTLEAGGAVMDRLRCGVERLGIPHESNLPARVVTVSAGVAEFDACVDVSTKDWLARADGALYRAKGHGRNCVALDVSPRS
jgi:diguanylate cyclase (GGDEF)-like protein